MGRSSATRNKLAHLGLTMDSGLLGGVPPSDSSEEPPRCVAAVPLPREQDTLQTMGTIWVRLATERYTEWQQRER